MNDRPPTDQPEPAQRPAAIPPPRRVRRVILIASGILLLAILLLPPIFVVLRPDPNAPRSIAGPPKVAFRSHYDWLNDIPFQNGRVWLATWATPTNGRWYLYDLDHASVVGELSGGRVGFANRDQSKLLVTGYGSGMPLFKYQLLALPNKLTMGRIPLPSSNDVERVWILDLTNNSARQIGVVSQEPGTGSAWHQSPDFHYGYTIPTSGNGDDGFLLCDIEKETLENIKFSGQLEGWWDDHDILVKDHGDNFVLFDVTTKRASTLFSAESLVNSLQRMGLATNLDTITAFRNWNGREFDFYFRSYPNGPHRIEGASYLLKADRASQSLVLLDRNFEFKFAGHLNEGGTQYVYPEPSGALMYPGTSGALPRKGNGGVFLFDLSKLSTRTIIPPNSQGGIAIPRFYKDSIIYLSNGVTWRIDINGSNNVPILPPTGSQSEH
jgi:hypothetical protein